jgi:hypothetical protein
MRLTCTLTRRAPAFGGFNGRLHLNRNSGLWQVNAALWGVSPGFESNDLGFMGSGDRAGAHVRRRDPDVPIDPDSSGPAAAFAFANPDFNFKSLRVNAIFRWELKPGSALYLVWTRQQQDFKNPGDFQPGGDTSALFSERGDDVFLVKWPIGLDARKLGSRLPDENQEAPHNGGHAATRGFAGANPLGRRVR